MKKLSIYLIAIFFISAFTITSCKDKDPIEPDADPAFTVLVDYLKANNLDMTNIIGTKGTSTFFVTAPPADNNAIAGFVANYTVLDIRSSEAYSSGYITGAKNVTFANLLTEAEAAANRPLIVCYTGQSACYATALLRLAGYDAQALKWGMSGWHSDFSGDWWDAKVSNFASSDLVTTAAPTNQSFADPVLTETIEDGAALLDARVSAVLADGFKGETGANVVGTPTNYFINNYFSEAHYLGFGHISGAYRINPVTLAGAEYNNLDPGKKIITYCYTGQTSAIISAYLRVLGYDAYSLTFGMNGLWNENPFWADDAIKNQWGFDSNPKELNYVGIK